MKNLLLIYFLLVSVPLFGCSKHKVLVRGETEHEVTHKLDLLPDLDLITETCEATYDTNEEVSGCIGTTYDRILSLLERYGKGSGKGGTK